MEASLHPDQRQAPRFKTAIKAKLTNDGNTVDVLICNISSSGLQIECPAALAVKLMPNQPKTSGQSPNPIELRFTVETREHQQRPINIQCNIIYVRRKSMEQFLLGCRFHEFIDDSNSNLQAYLQHFATREQSLDSAIPTDEVFQ